MWCQWLHPCSGSWFLLLVHTNWHPSGSWQDESGLRERDGQIADILVTRCRPVREWLMKSSWGYDTFRNFCLQLSVRICIPQVTENRSTENGLYSCTRIQQILSTRNHRSTRTDRPFLTGRNFVQRNSSPNIRSLWPKIMCDKRDRGTSHDSCTDLVGDVQKRGGNAYRSLAWRMCC